MKTLFMGLVLLAWGWAGAPIGHATQSGSDLTSWTFREDFGNGIPGWMSYPLVQDVGYDPTLWTQVRHGRAELVRQIPSEGERRLEVGIVKPLHFYADRNSSILLTYQLRMGGQVRGVQLLLAAEDGRLFAASLPPASGWHGVTVTGEMLELPAEAVSIQAVLIEARVQAPCPGSLNRLRLRRFAVQAKQPRSLPIFEPPVVRPGTEGLPVDGKVLSPGQPLELSLGSRDAVRVSLYQPNGKLYRTAVLSPSIGSTRARGSITLRKGIPGGLWRAGVQGSGASTEFHFVVVTHWPAHPRVLLRVKRLAELRALFGHNGSLNALVERARRLRSMVDYNPEAGANIALLPRISVFPGLPSYFALMENYSNAIADNAVEYCLNGSQEALAAARRALMTVVQWPTWTPPWFPAHGLHTYYEVGVFGERVALGYDLIATELSLAEKRRILEAFWKNLIEPVVEDYFVNNRVPIAATNHMAHSVGGALAAVVALAGDVPGWNARLDTALAELTVAYAHLLRGLFPGDGSEAEPAGYQLFAMKGMSYGLAALNSLGMQVPGTEGMLRSYWWCRYAEVRPNLVLDTGDFGGDLQSLGGFALEAEQSGDPSLRAFYDTAVFHSMVAIPKLRHTGRELENAPGLLDLTCCSQPAVPAPIPPLSRLFPLRGSAVLRSGWKPTDTVISIRVGPWFNHEHHDQGSFQVAAFGEKLISEAGYADYYKDPYYPTYFMQAPGHNTILLDNDAFSQPGEAGRYWKAVAQYPRFTMDLLSPEVDYLDTNLAPAYAGRLEQFDRQFIFLKPSLLIVADDVQSSEAHRFDWLLHIPIGAQARIEGADAFIETSQARAMLTASGANTQWMLKTTPVAANRYENLDRQRLRQPQELRLVSPLQQKTGFLVGIDFEPRNGAPRPLRTIEQAGAVGFAQTEGETCWKVIFRTSPGRVLEVDNVSSDGEILAEWRGHPAKRIFTMQATSLSIDHHTAFQARPAVSAVVSESSTQETLFLFLPAETDLKVRMSQEPVRLMLDGQPFRAIREGEYLVFEHIGRGDHEIHISR
jgi:hypothetical protein